VAPGGCVRSIEGRRALCGNVRSPAEEGAKKGDSNHTSRSKRFSRKLEGARDESKERRGGGLKTASDESSQPRFRSSLKWRDVTIRA